MLLLPQDSNHNVGNNTGAGTRTANGSVLLQADVSLTKDGVPVMFHDVAKECNLHRLLIEYSSDRNDSFVRSRSERDAAPVAAAGPRLKCL